MLNDIATVQSLPSHATRTHEYGGDPRMPQEMCPPTPTFIIPCVLDGKWEKHGTHLSRHLTPPRPSHLEIEAYMRAGGLERRPRNRLRPRPRRCRRIWRAAAGHGGWCRHNTFLEQTHSDLDLGLVFRVAAVAVAGCPGRVFIGTV